jgi:DNA-binding response OmpR family regulator
MARRALVVVDEGPAVSESIAAVLKSVGVDTVILTKAVDAPVLLTSEQFAMLILDLHELPQAFALARDARESGFNRATPIILMSDDQSTTAVAEGFEAGVSFFLYKPVDEARLLKLVQATSDAASPKKRRFRRVALQSRVHLAFAQRELEAETIDVSLNGMLVRAQGHFPAGSNVRIRLYLSPEIQPIAASGYVMRNLAGNRMAIQLDRLTPADTGRLQEFLLPFTMAEHAAATAGVA